MIPVARWRLHLTKSCIINCGLVSGARRVLQEIFRRFFLPPSSWASHIHSPPVLSQLLRGRLHRGVTFLVFLPDGRPVVALIRQVKRRRALQACNPPRDSLVDGAPMALAPWVTMPREPLCHHRTPLAMP